MYLYSRRQFKKQHYETRNKLMLVSNNIDNMRVTLKQMPNHQMVYKRKQEWLLTTMNSKCCTYIHIKGRTTF